MLGRKPEQSLVSVAMATETSPLPLTHAGSLGSVLEGRGRDLVPFPAHKRRGGAPCQRASALARSGGRGRFLRNDGGGLGRNEKADVRSADETLQGLTGLPSAEVSSRI